MNDLKEHIENLVEVISNVDSEKVTILTGNNGSGKSLIRRQLPLRFKEDGLEIKVRSISMDTRTQQNHNFGALRSMGMDDPDMPTSYNTLRLINGVVDSIMKTDEKVYLVLDEFEIGCSEETVMSLIFKINEIIVELKKKNIGVLIITHSRLVVKYLYKDVFINLEGKNEQEWIDRQIIPTDLEVLKENSLFRAIRDRMKENKENK